jgi:N-acylglucosamine-6-phosphate 2-epimerase
MDKDTLLETLKGRLIVSCQALDDEPLHSPFIMGRMALAAKQGGAAGIRANTPEDITEIRQIVDLPVIGLYKKAYEGSEVYITPTMAEIDALAESGCDIIAMDATDRTRPGGLSLDAFFCQVRKAHHGRMLMADCSTLEECLHARDLGFDLVGTTMRSYTPYTKGVRIPDFELMRMLKKELGIPFIAEGGIWSPEEARLAIECGAFAVVVGSAITRPQLITGRYARAVEGK